MDAIERREFLYSREDLSRLDALASAESVRVWTCVADLQRVFETDEAFLRATPESWSAATPNHFDEVISVILEAKAGKFRPSSTDRLLFDSVRVERICVLRTLLTYTSPVVSKPELRLVPDDADPTKERVNQAIAELLASREPVMRHSEVVTHPDRENSLPDRHVNVVDAGFVLYTDHGPITCLPWMNAYTCGPAHLDESAVARLERGYEFLPARRLLLGAV